MVGPASDGSRTPGPRSHCPQGDRFVAAFSLTCTTCRALARAAMIRQSVRFWPVPNAAVWFSFRLRSMWRRRRSRRHPKPTRHTWFRRPLPQPATSLRFREDFPLADAPADDAVPGTDAAPQQGPAAVHVAALPEATEYPLREEWWLVRDQQWWWIGERRWRESRWRSSSSDS